MKKQGGGKELMFKSYCLFGETRCCRDDTYLGSQDPMDEPATRPDWTYARFSWAHLGASDRHVE